MSTLFNTLLLTSHANHWAVTRPILSLILASESSFAGTYDCIVRTKCTGNLTSLWCTAPYVFLFFFSYCALLIILTFNCFWFNFLFFSTSFLLYSVYQAELVRTQTPENQEKLTDEFTKLTADIQRSVETANRDRFTQKLTVFRLNVRLFLTF